MNGQITRRLLVSTLVDPDEVAARLPAGIRPHVVEGGTVIGCCLLELSAVRPAGVPAVAGRPVRAAAHRMSVEWDVPDGVEVGVFVPVRLTDSRLAALAGGRVVPGVHHRVPYRAWFDRGRLGHVVEDPTSPFHLEVEVRRAGGVSEDAARDITSATCLAARVGLSPRRRGGLDAIRMEVAHHCVEAVEIDHLVSPFLASFESAGQVVGRLLSDASVCWSRATPPAASAGVLR